MINRSIIIRGPLGVGKSTIAKRLASTLTGCYISVDEILSEHQLDKRDGIPVENFITANSFIDAIVKKSLCPHIIIDGNFYYQEQIDNLVKMISGDIIIFTLNASIETCLKRNSARDNVYSNDAVKFVYDMVSKVEVGINVDTEYKSENQVVEEIVSQLE